jgi:hypothetical protein
MIPARDALERLRDGNRRFVAAERRSTRLIVVLRHTNRDANRAMLEELIEKNGLCVAGAECSLEAGVVDFFDGVPQARPECSAAARPRSACRPQVH